jgi:hypothetical protein
MQRNKDKPPPPAGEGRLGAIGVFLKIRDAYGDIYLKVMVFIGKSVVTGCFLVL